MKKLYLLLLVFLVSCLIGNSQENLLDIKEALPQIEKGEYKGTFINDSLVNQYLNEYLIEAEKRGLILKPYILDINMILIEPESSDTPMQLTGINLGKVDRERKTILLSSYCLLDRLILESTLFRELSHYLGVPYDLEGFVIMSLKKPYGYSYSWLDDVEIMEIEYDRLFAELKNYIN